MATSTPADWNRWLTDPLALGAAASGYLTDAWQRSLLYADIRRQRGNQYREHLRETAPNTARASVASSPTAKSAPRSRPGIRATSSASPPTRCRGRRWRT